MIECVLDRVFSLSSDPVVDSVSVAFPNSQFSSCASQTHSFLEKRSASGTLACDKSEKARMNVKDSKTMSERTPVQSSS